MAEDDSSKTEDPSGRKLGKARGEGQVAQSREVNTWFMLAVSGGLIMVMGPSIGRTLLRTLEPFLELHPFLDSDGILWGPIGAAAQEVALAFLVPMLFMVIAAIAGTLVQTGIIFAFEKFSWDISRMSPVAGLGRLFSMRSLVDFGRNLAKIAVVAALMVWLMRPEIANLERLTTVSAGVLSSEIFRLIVRLLLSVLAVLTAVAGADFFYQRFAFLKSMRMSKQEVKEENKQSEGDPMIKSRLRQIRYERARRRMMAAVPGASVVITNPTHYAVALKYEMGATGAPRVVAKGADLIALRIRELAKEHQVPVVENPPVARALFASVELDQEIPPEHYKAVAEIISYVFKLKGKMKGATSRPPASMVR